jgi:(5-formylfuran-3-yl)methyl phosphate synthase
VAARAAGRLVALAGSLDGDAIARLAGLADVVGVRGAACRGGRSGEVDAGRVAELRRRVGPAAAPAPLR